ncbi:C25 family cysteine peptidase [uncultured Hymenobacter sp.]|uniref:putative type IX secretion system sortase PorU2 n=1 Tax=uncultured Hymenobacter sp. TaxID=170016 RepID=UPI0035CBE7AC
MKNQYNRKQFLGWYGLLLVWLLAASPAAAQNPGLFGNEWIVPSQQYYKIKVLKDGLYRIDQQYLAQAGISGVNPQRIQLWRRGQEVAIYAGGNQSTLDATTFFEFYGQRNDGKLDRAFYKGGTATQPHDLYSLYTDTAAYFLTWSATANGKRMAPVATTPTAAPHPTRLAQRQVLFNGNPVQGQFAYVNDEPFVNVYQPWGEAGEGFLSVRFGANGGNQVAGMATDSAWAVARTAGTLPQVELLFVGAWSGAHTVQVSVLQPGTNTERVLGSVSFNGYEKRLFRYALRNSDVGPSGTIVTYARDPAPKIPGQQHNFRVGYVRYTYPQASRWRSGLKQMAFLNDSTLTGPAYYAVDSLPATVRGFDLTDIYNMQRVEGVALAGQQRGYSFPSATASQTRRLLLADEAQAAVPRPAVRVRFRTLNAATSNFLIISHTALMRPVGNVANPVRAYADYRHSAAGGRYDTVVVTSEQLYNQFHYGEKSVMAMRNYVRWELANSPATQTNYLLLLGKGLIVGEYSRSQLAPAIDLVPSTTRSGSDNFLSADWENNRYVARMPTGRLSATQPQEVVRYLNKLKEHEALGAEPWRKHLVHMAGGTDATEYSTFERYIDKYKQLAERPLFGGQVVTTYRRRLSGGTNFPVNITLAPEVNAGVSLITYFGHGSTSDFDLNFGDPTEPGKGYNNAGKYPVFLLNGCAANAVDRNTNIKTVSENWIFAENKGAVGFMAASDESFAYDLDAFTTEFYKVAFNDPAWYGKPIPVLQAEAARRMLITTGGAASTIAQAMINVWLGDPALRFFSPERPDFITSNTDLQIQANGSGQVQASSPNFKLLVHVRNPGKITYDSLDVRITRTYPATSTGTRPPDIITRTVRQAWHDTTYTFVLNNTGNVFGDNRFDVALDYRNRVAEISETNNSGQLTFNFLQGGVRTIWPPEFAIVPAVNLRLVGQTNDPRGASRTYEMELDTVPTFTSALKQARTVTTTLVPDWRPTLPSTAGRDSVVWYWRLRFQTPTGDESRDWATSSFRVIPGSAGGWSQSHHGQFTRDQLTGMKLVAPSGRWNFDDVQEPIVLTTRGGGTGPATFSQLTDGISTSTSPYVANCAVTQPNMMVAVFSGRTLRPVRNIAGTYDSCGQANLRFYHFASSAADNINSPVRQAQLQALLTNVQPGDYVALISMNKVNFATFSTSLKATLTSLGAQRINQLQDGEPYALLVQKGPNPRVVREVTADPASSTLPVNQVVILTDTLLTRASSGRIASTQIGPARQWLNLYHTVRTPDPSDSYTLKLVGIDTTNTERVLDANVTSRSLALANISAQQYPYLQLVLELRDTLNRTAPQLEQWLVTYQGIPEGIVRRDLATPASAYDPATLARQAAETGFVTVPMVFQNVSSIDFSGPMKARILLRNEGTGVREALVDVPGGALRADSQVSFEAKVNVVGLTGALRGNVVVNPSPRALPELYAFNNELLLDPFRVDDRNVPPTLDVAFDGIHILNGDIVSPTPIITVQMRDDDRLRRIKNVGNFQVLLTSANQVTVPVDLTGSNVRFSSDSTKGTAQIEVRMGQNTPLENGIYTLEVQGRDATGKAAAVEPYRITFEVINESTISNIYPYPNPVTSKTKFVFTLTGTTPPRDMKIQVLTLTGRVVREIMMAELGPLRIGNNISEYAWDGTDEYGDKLANGTYLYRVILDDPESAFSRRPTAGDKAFKKDWGKLVLLR